MRVKLPMLALLAGEFTSSANDEISINPPKFSSNFYLFLITEEEPSQAKRRSFFN